MGSRGATGALNQMLHTPVVQSEPNTFTPEVFPALHPHPVYRASGSGEEAAGN